MRFKTINGCTEFSLSGRIDGTNAPFVEREIMEILDNIAPEPEKLMIDMSGLEYISSAGLRVLLKLRKRIKNVEVTGVSDRIYDIMDMTGFSEMIKVSQTMREISVEGKEPVRRNSFGETYRLDEESMVKVYYTGHGLDMINRIKTDSRELFSLGIPALMSFDTVKVGDRYGIIFEAADSLSLAKIAERNQENIEKYGRMMGRLMKTLHETADVNGRFVNYSDRVTEWIDILEKRFGDFCDGRTIEVMRSIQRGFARKNTLIHGDLHEGNVIMQDGELLLCDIDEISCGNPVFDHMSSFLEHDFIAENAPNAAKMTMGIGAQILPRLRRYTVAEYCADNVEETESIEKYVRLLYPFRLLLTPAIAYKNGSRAVNERVLSAMFGKFIPILNRNAEDMITAAAYFNLTY